MPSGFRVGSSSMAVQSRLCRYHLFFYAPIVYRFRTLDSMSPSSNWLGYDPLKVEIPGSIPGGDASNNLRQ